MRVRIAQIAPVPRATGENLARIRQIAQTTRDTDLLVFPELFVSGYQVDALDALALDPAGEELAKVRAAAAAAGTAIVAGFAERTPDGVANSAFAVESTGEVAGVYRKTHLFGGERDAFVPGDRIVPVPLAGRSVGLMICFDVEFPEVARTLAVQGAELLLTISANMDPYARDHAVYAQSRALENGLPHVYANRVGSESGARFVGESSVFDGAGAVVGSLEGDADMLDVTVPESAARGEALAYLDHLRPTLYRLPRPTS